MLYVILFAALIGSLGLLLVLYALLGKGPRIRRAFRQIDHLLNEGHWEQALEAIDALQVKTGLTTDSTEQGNRRAAEWVAELRRVSAQAHQAAADQALKDKDFDAGTSTQPAGGLPGRQTRQRGPDAGGRSDVGRGAPPVCRQHGRERNYCRLCAAGRGGQNSDGLPRGFFLAQPVPDSATPT